jgi:hypothetical protein
VKQLLLVRSWDYTDLTWLFLFREFEPNKRNGIGKRVLAVLIVAEEKGGTEHHQ